MRLIDVHALIDEINEMWKIHPARLENRKILSFEAVIDLIGAAHTIEAKPVVHAHWFMTEYEYFDCSNCGVSIWNGCDSTAQAKQMLANKEVMFKFCPYCGAQMDEEVSE